MTRRLGMEGSGAWYDDVAIGETFARSVTVTDTHIVLGAGLDKPKHGGGIVVLHGVCRNQDDVVVAEADGKILVRARG